MPYNKKHFSMESNSETRRMTNEELFWWKIYGIKIFKQRHILIKDVTS